MQTWFIIIATLLSIAGIILIAMALVIGPKRQYSFANALPAIGTVVELGIRQPRPFKFRRFSAPSYTQVTIEFQTANNFIVRGDIDANFTLYYSGQYKLGDKINLLYNSDKPTEFIVTSLQSTKTARIIMLCTGLFLLLTVIGMILLTHIFSFFPLSRSL